MITKNIEGKVVVITGASSGLGQATARLLSAEGAAVVLAARRAERIEALADELNGKGGKALAVATDVTDRQQVKSLVDKAVEAYGRVDVMLNNAGLMPLAPIERLKFDDWNQMIDVNIKGVMHGIAAALLMATARGLLRSRADQPGTLAQMFTDVNRQLCLSSFEGRFMTLFYLVLDVPRRQARWLSAGHDPALVYDPDADAFEDWAGQDIPLGIETQWQFSEFEAARLEPGRLIVLGTDGVWECRNGEGEFFGKQRLQDLIREHHAQPCDAIAEAVMQALRGFRAGVDQQDDITLVVIKTRPGAAFEQDEPGRAEIGSGQET